MPSSASNPTPLALDGLTGIRGILALWIVLLHVLTGLLFSKVNVGAWLPVWLIHTAQAGDWAVDGFFMLSGFVLSHVYGQDMSRGLNWRRSLGFLGHRIARIYPVHLVMLCAYVAAKLAGIVFAVETCGNPLQPVVCNRFSLAALAQQLLLISSWHWNPTTSWNVVAWSISSEWFAYLSFSLLILGVVKFKGMATSLCLAALALGAMLTVLRLAGMGPVFGEADDYGLVRVSGGFVCGALLYRVYLAARYRALPWHWLGPISAVAVVVAVNSAWPWTPPFFLALLLLSLAQARGPLSRALSTRPMLWLGKVSYALYTCHLFVLELLGVVFKDPHATPLSQLPGWNILGLVFFLVGAPLLLAALLHYTVEEPGRKWLRKVFDGLAQSRPAKTLVAPR